MCKAEESKKFPPARGLESQFGGSFLRALRREEWSRTILLPRKANQGFAECSTAQRFRFSLSTRTCQSAPPWVAWCDVWRPRRT